MKKIINIILISLAIGFSSCADFLDMEPTTSVSADGSIQTVDDAEVMLNGLMYKMSSSYYYGRNFILYGDTKGGDLAIRSQGRGYDALYTFNHSASSNSYSTYWSQMYNCMAQVNNIIENIDILEAADSEENFSHIKGQALTTRANIYYDLVRLYGQPYNMDKTAYGVPDITEVLDASAQPSRATVAENYDRIISDLTTAIGYMDKGSEDGYHSYYSNLALQARVYLSMDNYDNALTAAEEIINSGEYQLYENDNWYNSWTSEFGSESIFEIKICVDEADLGTSSLGYYLMCKGTTTSAMGQFMASDYFLNRLGEDADDVRWSVMTEDETSTTEAPRYGSCVKYSLGDKGSTTAVNIKVIRLSEIYLIAAEAALSSSSPDKDKAVGYLNEIRKRAPNLDLATTATITLDMILDEKSKELFAEGHRYFDMLRTNQEITFNDDFIDSGITLTTRDKTIDRTFYKTILPIDQDEINANPTLESQQNPGY